MWFEIIPSAAIITVAMAMPIHIGYVLHKLVLGNVSKQPLFINLFLPEMDWDFAGSLPVIGGVCLLAEAHQSDPADDAEVLRWILYNRLSINNNR